MGQEPADGSARAARLFDTALWVETEAERLRIFRLLVATVVGVGLVAVGLIAVVDPPVRLLAVQTLVSLAVVGTVALWLSGRGRARAASWVLLLGLIAVVTHDSWFAGRLRGPGVGSLLLIPLLAGFLLGRGGTLLTGILCAGSAAALAVADFLKLPPVARPVFSPVSRLLLFVVYLVILLVVSGLMAGSVLSLVRRLKQELAERRRAELRLEMALNAATTSVWEYDLMTSTTRLDDRAFTIFGTAPTQEGVVSAERSWSRVHPEDRPLLERAIHEIAAGEERVQIEFRAIRADGAERTIHLDAAGFPGPAHPGRIVGTMRDVTELVQAQRERERLQAVLTAVLDSSDDMIWAVDPEQFRLIASNRRFDEHFARNAGIVSPLGRRMVDLFPSDEYRERWNGLLQRALHEGPFVVDEYRTAHGDLVLELHIGLLRREEEVFGISIYGRDITEQEAAEAEKRNSEARFRAIFDASPNGVAISRDGRVLVANPAAARMFGWSDPAALSGHHISDLFTAESANLMVARQQARLAGATLPSAYEVTGVHPDGSTFPAHMQLVVIELPDGPAILGFFQDLTDKRKAEEEQARVETQLRHAQQMEAIGTLAAGFAHDFNNVLAPILGTAELAAEQLPPDSGVREDMAIIDAAARRAQALVRQILLLSRSDEQTEPVPVDLIHVVQETVQLLRAGLPSTVEIRADLPARCAPALGNATWLHQVLLNLCTNARDAMGGAGTLTIALREVSPGEETPDVGSPRAEPWILLSVSDTGSGMSPDVQRRIFEPYFSTKPRGKGTGLGLSVSQGIVSSMGGQIRVRSAPGAGSTFEVLLPASTRTDGVEPAKTSFPRGRGERILVIDDEPASRAVMVRMLTMLGYTPAEVEEPEAVLALVRSAPDALDVLITDQTMPQMLGTQLALECVALRPDLPIILCTGDAPRPGRLPPGIRRVLEKPFRIAAVAEALRSALSDRQVAPG